MDSGSTIDIMYLYHIGMHIILMMEAVRTSETLVNFNVTTRHYIPEESKLRTRRRENLISHIENFNFSINPFEAEARLYSI
jgi:hypothetical protein